ncbi:MAG: ACP S-malonyltransferase [Pelagibacterales bacterium]|nr:ACP S-malonyltransferase [Pelagibacterales bacterium]
MKSYVFPGQGSQFTGMCHDLYEKHNSLKEMFQNAKDILGFDISKIMFHGSSNDLVQTKVTQPAIFIHSMAILKVIEKSFNPAMVAGHSLGEFSALVAAGVLSFEDGLKLVSIRAKAMQRACENTKGTMAAILGLENNIIENVCKNIIGNVVAANYNCPGQVVISGEIKAVEEACRILTEKGARRALILPVGGAFHSELMNEAKEELSQAINEAKFNEPICPVYQNVKGIGETSVISIKENLVSQLTSTVRWTQSINQMIEDGATEFIEIGPGKVLQGLIKKINRDILISAPLF